ncbi:MAG: hypothetical protein Q7R81_00515 [Candidatus Peregrinibacteria bacterium]|nr:hypothetical protein [Candidatus Peregrinibacteria bacterium]
MWLLLQCLAVTLWAGVNVLDSLLVHHYEKHPIILMWTQSCFTVPTLLTTAILFPTPPAYVVMLVGAGVVAYTGDLVFFRVLEAMDVSVTNIAWAILSVFLSVLGVVVLSESWTALQTAGAVLVFAGAVALSLWQRRVTAARSLLLLPFLALLYTPFYFVQEVALRNGDSIIAVSLWSLLGRECTAFFSPCFVPAFRRRILTFLPRSDLRFWVISGSVIALFLTATVLTSAAFAVGPLSLVAVVGNIQPFIVLALAYFCVRLFPRFAPREILTAYSVTIKIFSFSAVFAGLALLAFSR